MVVTRSAAGKRVLRDISNQVDHQARQTTYAGKLLPTVASPGKADSKNDLLDLIDCLAEINLSPTRPTSHTEVEKATDWLAQVSLSPKQTTKDESAFETLVCELDCALDELKLLGFQNYNNMVQQSTKALGSGKSGTVYEASLCTGPIVAVKTFTLNEKPADSPEDQTAAEYFRQQLGFFVEEAKMGFSACARGRANKKTNICQTLGVLRSDAQDGKVRASIVLEKVEGIDLVDFMSQPKYWRKSQYVGTGRYFIRQEEDDALYEYTLPRHEKLAIAYELASALAESHRHGVLHCDIKPENTMLSLSPSACNAPPTIALKLIDFGLSVSVGCTDCISAGTPGYEAPEAEDFGEVSAKSDVYSLGKTLGELWTGSAIGLHDEEEAAGIGERVAEQCQEGKAARALEFLHWEGEHSKDVEKLLDADRRVGVLVARCLAAQPEHRPTAAQLSKKLRFLLRQQQQQH